ncbi:hypothetical protein F383_30801 [Gossypium arboreum]|uniref:Uncharacterized protein n=1 Tax=Gossypium arboreum TaxID=29729 RepID=A0A0B0PIZ4_GOSAR|nr:hypothetical protein F383_30801 [Gossypium arboreum]
MLKSSICFAVSTGVSDLLSSICSL